MGQMSGLTRSVFPIKLLLVSLIKLKHELANGQGCNSDLQCVSGNCAEYVCCDSPGCPTCQSCVSDNPGYCTPVNYGSTDPSCPVGTMCNDVGECRYPDGYSCSVPGDCLSNSCFQNICGSTPPPPQPPPPPPPPPPPTSVDPPPPPPPTSVDPPPPPPPVLQPSLLMTPPPPPYIPPPQPPPIDPTPALNESSVATLPPPTNPAPLPPPNAPPIQPAPIIPPSIQPTPLGSTSNFPVTLPIPPATQYPSSILPPSMSNSIPIPPAFPSSSPSLSFTPILAPTNGCYGCTLSNNRVSIDSNLTVPFINASNSALTISPSITLNITGGVFIRNDSIFRVQKLSKVFVLGTLDISRQSSLILEGNSSIAITGDIVIDRGFISVGPDSTLKVNGCLKQNSSSLKVVFNTSINSRDLDGSSIVVFDNITTSCSSYFDNIELVGLTDECIDAVQKLYDSFVVTGINRKEVMISSSTQLTVELSFNEERCGETHVPLALILGITIPIVLLAVIVAIVLLAVKPIREKLFPHRDRKA